MSTAQTITEAAFSQVVPVRCLAPYNHYSHVLIVTLVPLAGSGWEPFFTCDTVRQK